MITVKIPPTTLTPIEPLISEEQSIISTSTPATSIKTGTSSKQAIIINPRKRDKPTSSYYRYRYTSESQEGRCMFCIVLKSFFLAIYESVFFAFCVLGFFVLSIAEICISSIYVYDCPAQPRIENFLFALGIASIVSLLVLSILTKIAIIERRRLANILFILLVIINTFLLLWIFAGSVWTLQIYKLVNYNALPDSKNYCDKTLYRFTLVTLVINCVIVMATSWSAFLTRKCLDD